MLHRVAIAALIVVVCSALRPWAAPQGSPTFRTNVDLIEVDVRVTDQRGVPVRDLTAEDFAILEDGVPQPVATFSFVDLESAAPVKNTNVLSVDADVVSNDIPGRMWVLLIGGFGERARLVARSFINDALSPIDDVAIVFAHGNMSAAQGFTRNRRLLLDAIGRLGESPSNAGLDRNRTGYQVLEDLALRLGSFQGRRKAIVYFDPPEFFAPSGTSTTLAETALAFGQRDALRAATRNNVTIYVVSTRGLTTELSGSLSPPPIDPLRAAAGQRLLAEETGGDAVVNSNDFRAAFERFVRDSSTYYMLGYAPSSERADGRFHNIQVIVRRPGVTVRARGGYYADRVRGVDAPLAVSQVRGVREALRLPLSMSGLPITLFAAPFAGPGRDGNVLLGAQLVGDELKLAAGATLEVGYQAMTTEGRVTPGAIRQGSLSFSEAARRGVEETGLRILEHMTIPPGRHQVRFAVHQSDGKTGMVVADVDVPEFTKEALSMSGLVLSSEQTNKDQTLPGDLAMRMPIVPTAKRSFSRSDTLTAYVEVYTNGRTPIERVRLRATISQEGERTSRELPTRTVDTERPGAGHLVDIPLAQFPAGAHVLTLEAREGRRNVVRQVLFTLK